MMKNYIKPKLGKYEMPVIRILSDPSINYDFSPYSAMGKEHTMYNDTDSQDEERHTPYSPWED